MIKWRQLVYTIIVVVIFLVLTVIAAVNYSGDEAENRASQNDIYRRLNDIIDSGQEFFKSWPFNIQENKHNEKELAKEGWNKRMLEYIQISREKDGLIIIMKNSQGEFFKKIWPMFTKKEEK